MPSAAQLSITELRGPNRHPVNHHFLAEHRRLGDIELHVANISAHGFMTGSETGLSRGERVVIRLPHIGRIEAHLVWASGVRAGFQFERILRSDDFVRLIAAVRPHQQLCPIGARPLPDISS